VNFRKRALWLFVLLRKGICKFRYPMLRHPVCTYLSLLIYFDIFTSICIQRIADVKCLDADMMSSITSAGMMPSTYMCVNAYLYNSLHSQHIATVQYFKQTWCFQSIPLERSQHTCVCIHISLSRYIFTSLYIHNT